MVANVQGKFYLITAKTMQRILHHLQGQSELSIDLETSGFDYFQDEIVGASIDTGDSTYYFPLKHAGENVDSAEFFNWLKEHRQKRWILHNGKFDWQFLMNKGIDLNIEHDTMIMAHLLDTNRSRTSSLGLKFLMEDVLGWEPQPEYTKVFGKTNLRDLTGEQVCEYACRDAYATLLLKNEFIKTISQYSDLYRLEMQLLKVVGKMEMDGIKIDLNKLQELSCEYEVKIPKLRQEIHSILGCEVELNSPQKLGVVLKEKAKIPLTKRTKKTGKLQLTKEILESLAESYPVVGMILDYRKMVKMSGTFVKNLQGFTHKQTGRVHAEFLQVHVCSGRFASANPNMQNIPVVNDVKRDVNIRTAIVPTEGFILASLDYAQIEVRILLAVARSRLVQRLKSGEHMDIHQWMGSIVFGKDEPKVTKEERRAAKTVTFGIAYGMSEYGLAKRLIISVEKAKAIINMYFEKVEGVADFIENTHQYVQRYGFVTTCWGRRREFPEAVSSHDGFGVDTDRALRGAVNHIIQGTAADVLKIAMLRVSKFIDRTYPGKVRMLATVHDELVFEVSKKLDIKKAINELKARMTVHLAGVPLTVDAKIGQNWGELADV